MSIDFEVAGGYWKVAGKLKLTRCPLQPMVWDKWWKILHSRPLLALNFIIETSFFCTIFLIFSAIVQNKRPFFSSGQVSYCHHWASVVCRPSSVHPLTFHILINSSEAAGPIWTKLWWNGPWMAPFQNCVRWSQLPTKMVATLKIEKKGDEI